MSRRGVQDELPGQLEICQTCLGMLEYAKPLPRNSCNGIRYGISLRSICALIEPAVASVVGRQVTQVVVDEAQQQLLDGEAVADPEQESSACCG